jgi:PAS domain-containing protein
MDVGSVNMILNVITILLGGTALGVVLRYKAKIKELQVGQHGADRAADRVDFDAITAVLTNQRDEAWAHIKEQDARIDQMEAEIQGLRLARDLDPFPNWVVDLQGCYQYVNRAFEEHFLEPKGQTYRDAIGKCHEDLWPPDFCRTLKALDAEARRRPDGTARAHTSLDVPSLGTSQVMVHKFPIRFKPSNSIVAFAGFITDMEPQERRMGK